MNTDTHATVYTDFERSAVQRSRIGIDNDGRAVMVVDADKVYRIEMHDPQGNLVFTQQPVYPVGRGSGSGSAAVDVISTDGTIVVDKTTSGGTKIFDLSIADDSASSLDWIKCEGSETLEQDFYKPLYASGTMALGEQGILLGADRYYHVTAHVRATKTDVEPFYENVTVNLKTRSGSTVSTVFSANHMLDYSIAMSQDFELSTDVFSAEPCELVFEILYASSAVAFELHDVEVHRVYSGMPQGGGGSFEQVQSDWTQENSAEPSYIQHRPEVKTVVEGDNIDIVEGETTFTISADLSSCATREQITALQSQIIALQSTVSSLNSTINTLQTSVTDLTRNYNNHGIAYDSTSHLIKHLL